MYPDDADAIFRLMPMEERLTGKKESHTFTPGTITYLSFFGLSDTTTTNS